jgi:hypothetical protein
MGTSAVRVTLTADDQATEIVRRLSSAVKQLDTQNRTAATGTKQLGDAAGVARGAFDGLVATIGRLAAAFGAFQLIRFVGDTIHAADELGKLSLKTGVSTEALSVLGFVAKQADVNVEEMTNGLKFLSRSVAEAEAGSVKATTAFASLGLRASDFKGLSLDEVLVKIANAQANFSDGAGKAAVMMQLFGRNGVAMIPFLQELAQTGFAPARAEAERLGLVISGKTAAAADQFDDSLKKLTGSAKGFVNAMAPVLGVISKLIDFSTSLAVADREAFKLFGSLVTGGGVPQAGTAPSALPASATPGKVKPDVPFVDPAVFKALTDARLAAVRQQAKDEQEATAAGLKRQEQIEAASFAQGKRSLEDFFASKISITRSGVALQVAELQKERAAIVASPLDENTDAARIKRAQDIADIEAKIALTKVNGQTEVNGLLEQERVQVKALADNVAGFAATIAKGTGDEIGAAQIEIAKQAEAYKLTLQGIKGLSDDFINSQTAAFSNLLTSRAAFDEKQRQGQRALAELGIQRDQITTQANQGLITQDAAETQIHALEADRLPTLTKLADQMLFFAQQTKDPALIQAAQQFAASFAGIGVDVDKSDKLLKELGATVKDIAQNTISDFLTTGIDSLFTSQTSGLAALQNVLASTKDEMNQLLAGPQTVQSQQRVDELRQEVANLGIEIDATKKTLPTLANVAREALLSAVQSIQKAIAEILSTKLVEGISGLFDSTPQVVAATALKTAGATVIVGADAIAASSNELSAAGDVVAGAAVTLGASAAALAAAAAAANANSIATAFTTFGIFGLAEGGPVRGPGTGTSDSILARLSHGEFVVRADAVKHLGVGFLSALNAGARMPTLRSPSRSGLPAFASGGLVTGGGGTTDVSGGIDATIGLEEGLVIKHLQTRGGVRALHQVLSANPRLFRAALNL